ncbi:MAG: hypothetical protein HQ537_01585 [Parcubacteria group bacterium]|nr:hypothetical protein [Parcubacteria group bacterium]
MVEEIVNFYHNHPILYSLAAFFVFSLFTFFFLDPIFNKISDVFGKKPKIIVNVNEIEEIKSGMKLTDFNLLFGTYNGKAYLTAVKIGDKDLNKIFGYSPMPDKLVPCVNCVEYGFSLKNTGRKEAKDINIDLLSLSDLVIIKNEMDPKITNVNCGGILNNKGCRIKIDRLDINETVLFTGFAKGPGIRTINCEIDGNEEKCLLNFRNFYIHEVKPGFMFDLGDEKISFPPINETDNYVQYYYNVSKKEWIETDVSSL